MALSIIGFFAALGLPGLNGFISEFMVFIGAFKSPFFANAKLITMLASIGLLMTAGYILWTIQRVYLGPLGDKYKTMSDVNFREVFTLAPLAAICIVLGIFPNLALNIFDTSMASLIAPLQDYVAQAGGSEIVEAATTLALGGH
jgi:NADH-quinone oxidoreductase subunit M